MNGEARSRLIPDLSLEGAVVTAATGAAAALGAVAVYSPKVAIAALFGVAFLVAACSRLSLGIAVFVVLTFPEHLPGSLGAGATLAKPVGALIFLAWGGIAMARRGAVPLLPRQSPSFFLAMAAFVVFSSVSVLWAPDPAALGSALGRLLLVAALANVTYTAASTRSGFRTIVYGYLFGSVATSLYSVVTGSYVQKGRLATLFDPNYFAAELIPAILIACFLFTTAGSRRTRWLAATVAGVDLFAFVLTQSRGGIVGLSVALLVAVVVAARARPRMLVLVLVLVAAGLGYYFTFKPAHVFGSGVRGGLSATSSGRTDEWQIALRVAAGHPVGGVGLGNYSVVEPSYATQTFNLNFVTFIVKFRQVAHNTYLQLAAELGLVGLFLFLTIVALAMRAARRALRELDVVSGELEFLVRGLLAGTMGMLAAYIFLSAELEKQLWLVLALLASAPAAFRSDIVGGERG